MEKSKIIIESLIFIFVSLFLFLCLSLGYVSADTDLIPPIPSSATYIDIGVEKVHTALAENPEEIILLDIRSEEEYSIEYISGAKHIPLPELENRIGELNKTKNIIVYCKNGVRSREASEILVPQGFERVYNMLGGIEEWRVKFPEYISTLTPIPRPTPAPTEMGTPYPSLTPPASPLPSLTPTSTPAPGGKWGLPGFEAVSTIMVLLILASYFILLKRRR
ncbi:Thiosulfate sulfurtransferase GlpE [ANME-1 cluster archaeon GoMg1]|nr:Thiosulfate sulfurtransferase GlpE [ANME-1 cluster archaeon GoMg1]